MKQPKLFSYSPPRMYFDVEALHQRLHAFIDGRQLWIEYHWDNALAGGGCDVPGALFTVSFDYETRLYRFMQRGSGECYLDDAGFGQWHTAVTAFSRNAVAASEVVAFGERQLTYKPRSYKE